MCLQLLLTVVLASFVHVYCPRIVRNSISADTRDAGLCLRQYDPLVRCMHAVQGAGNACTRNGLKPLTKFNKTLCIQLDFILSFKIIGCDEKWWAYGFYYLHKGIENYLFQLTTRVFGYNSSSMQTSLYSRAVYRTQIGGLSG